MSEGNYYLRSRGRVSGPFAPEVLVKLVARGSLTRLDEVSADGTAWLPADQCEWLMPSGSAHAQLVDGGATEVNGTLDSSSGDVLCDQPNRPANTQSIASEPDERFLYFQGGQTIGPVPAALLKALASNGALKPDDLVWPEGSQTTQAARDLPLLVSVFAEQPRANETAATNALTATSPVLIAVVASVAAGLILVALVTLSILALPRRTESLPRVLDQSVLPPETSATEASTSPSMVAPVPSGLGSTRSDVIADIDGPAALQAVGRVVVGLRLVLADGRVVEDAGASGSCFLVSPSGYMLTNRHVVKDAVMTSADGFELDRLRRELRLSDAQVRIWVFLGKVKHEASIAYVSKRYDLAILRTNAGLRPYFALAEQRSESSTADVFALGYPGVASLPSSAAEWARRNQRDRTFHRDVSACFEPSDFDPSRTKGAISRVFSSPGDGANLWWIDHTAAIARGNSGGPLATRAGIVIGINTLRPYDTVTGEAVLRTLEISQLRSEIDAHIPDVAWK